jgi:hypothetical protein
MAVDKDEYRERVQVFPDGDAEALASEWFTSIRPEICGGICTGNLEQGKTRGRSGTARRGTSDTGSSLKDTAEGNRTSIPKGIMLNTRYNETDQIQVARIKGDHGLLRIRRGGPGRVAR